MLPLALAMSGCQTLSTVTSLDPVCTALGQPIRYTSKDKASQRYAAALLAPQLAEKNRTGINLDCPAYKR